MIDIGAFEAGLRDAPSDATWNRDTVRELVQRLRAAESKLDTRTPKDKTLSERDELYRRLDDAKERLRAAEGENVQLRSAGMSLNETIAKSAPRLQDAIDRLHKAESIVHDLAAIDMRTCNPSIERACPLCMVDLEYGDVPHAESCPYRRAIEATKP